MHGPDYTHYKSLQKLINKVTKKHKLTLNLNSVKQLRIGKQQLNFIRHALKDIANELAVSKNIIILYSKL